MSPHHVTRRSLARDNGMRLSTIIQNLLHHHTVLRKRSIGSIPIDSNFRNRQQYSLNIRYSDIHRHKHYVFAYLFVRTCIDDSGTYRPDKKHIP